LKYVVSLGGGVRIVLLAPSVTEEAERMPRRNRMEFRKISMLELTRILMHERSVEKNNIARYL